MALALDGSAHTGGASGTSAAVTLTTSIPNDVIIVVATVNGTTVSSISDTAGLTWARRKQQPTGTGHVIETWWAIASGALSADVITVTMAGTSGFITIDAFGVSGANTSAPFDANASLPAGVTSGDALVSTSSADTLIFGAYRFSATASTTAGTGFTAVSGADFQLVEYKIVAATQTNLDILIGTGSGDDNAGIGDAIVAASAAGRTISAADTLGNFTDAVGFQNIDHIAAAELLSPFVDSASFVNIDHITAADILSILQSAAVLKNLSHLSAADPLNGFQSAAAFHNSAGPALTNMYPWARRRRR